MKNITKEMDNQQHCNLSNTEKQLLLSLYFGDGCHISNNTGNKFSVVTSSVNRDFLEFKVKLIDNLAVSDIKFCKNSGYKKDGVIYKLSINFSEEITKIYEMSFEEKLNQIDELGLALWFYDDGSLHKRKLFYNLNTHAFSLAENILIQKRLRDFNINANILKDKKKDGRVFHYLSINKYNGAFEVSTIMSKISVQSMKYKLWCSETIQKWSTTQESWKSRGIYNIEDLRVKIKADKIFNK